MMNLHHPFNMDFSRYSNMKLIKLSEDDISLSHLDREDLLSLVSTMADRLRILEEEEESEEDY